MQISIVFFLPAIQKSKYRKFLDILDLRKRDQRYMICRADILRFTWKDFNLVVLPSRSSSLTGCWCWGAAKPAINRTQKAREVQDRILPRTDKFVIIAGLTVHVRWKIYGRHIRLIRIHLKRISPTKTDHRRFGCIRESIICFLTSGNIWPGFWPTRSYVMC